MRRRFASVLVVALSASSCVARSRINANCEWTAEPPSQLDIRRSPDVNHLVGDVTVAEDLAVRYADVTRGHRSGHFAGADAYTAARERCLATLFATVATTHGVDLQQVRDVRGQRPFAVDVTVSLSFAVLYFIFSAVVAGTVFRSFPVDEPTPAVVASLVAAVALSACGVIAFGLFAAVLEVVRIGNAHLSLRADRLPWAHHTLLLFAIGVLVFSAAAAFQYRRHHRDEPV
jgi:hypothetical protein